MTGPGTMRMMLILLDTDGNGALSLEEMQAAHAQVFTAMEGDDTGAATRGAAALLF